MKGIIDRFNQYNHNGLNTSGSVFGSPGRHWMDNSFNTTIQGMPKRITVDGDVGAASKWRLQQRTIKPTLNFNSMVQAGERWSSRVSPNINQSSIMNWAKNTFEGHVGNIAKYGGGALAAFGGYKAIQDTRRGRYGRAALDLGIAGVGLHVMSNPGAFRDTGRKILANQWINKTVQNAEQRIASSATAREFIKNIGKHLK